MTTPVATALLVCDNIYRESRGKTALVGIFSRITAVKFPARHGRLCVFASVTDLRHNTKLKLEIVHGETDAIIMGMEGQPPEDATPLSTCDLNFELNNLVFPEPGRYYIRLSGNDQILLERPFEVVELKPGTQAEKKQ
jgi:hypothetical protein